MHGIALPARRCKAEKARQSYQDESLLLLTLHDHVFHSIRSKVIMTDADEISISLFPSGGETCPGKNLAINRALDRRE
jgi:hypothetical protein